MKKRRQRTRTQEVDTTDYSEVIKRIKSVDEELLSKMTAVFWGRTGTGKTTLLSTFPKPILILDMREEGTDSVANLGKDVKVIVIQDWNEIEQIYWYLKGGKHGFKTIGWDTVSQSQDLCIREVMRKSGKKPGDHMSEGTWGTVSSKLKYWLLEYRDLPMNVVFNAHDRVNKVDEDEEQLIPEVGPQVIPSVAKTMTGAVKVIGHTFIKEVTKKTSKGLEVYNEYRLRISPHSIYQARIRKPMGAYAPSTIKDPTYEKLVKIMKGEHKPPTKKQKKG